MEAVTAYSRYYPCVYLEELTETMKTSLRIAIALEHPGYEHRAVQMFLGNLLSLCLQSRRVN
jgi:hypothetical protein